jgi:hypothetical protein
MSTNTSDRNVNYAIARMSPVVLRLLLDKHADNTGMPPLISSTADALLRDMLHLVPNFNSESLEIFHAQFETLRSELFKLFYKQQESTLGDLYPGAMVSTSPASRAMLQEMVPIRMRTLKRCNEKVTPKLTRAWCKAHMKHVVLPAAGNTGFDVVLPVDSHRVIVIDTKFTKQRVGKVSCVNVRKNVQNPRTKLDEALTKISGIAKIIFVSSELLCKHNVSLLCLSCAPSELQKSRHACGWLLQRCTRRSAKALRKKFPSARW